MTVRIRQRSNVKWQHNKLSGHEWPEETLIKNYDVINNTGVVKTFTSFEKACECKKEWEEFEKNFPFTPPRSQREIDKAIRLKL